MGKIVPVGGKIEAFETPYEAVLRETEEETGIKLASAKFCGTLTETSPTDYNWMSFIYTAEIDFIDPPYCDEGKLMWINESELHQYNIPATDEFIFNYVSLNKIFAFSAEYNAEMGLFKMKEEISNFLVLGSHS